MMDLEPVRVALVGSAHDLISGLRYRLGSHGDVQVVGTFHSVADAVSGIPEVGPDVIVVDAELADGRGVDVCARLRRDGACPACLVLSGLPVVTAMVDHAADAVVLKTLRGNLLEREILRLGRARSDPPGTIIC